MRVNILELLRTGQCCLTSHLYPDECTAVTLTIGSSRLGWSQTPPPPSHPAGSGPTQADLDWTATATAAQTEFIRVLKQASRLETQPPCSMRNTGDTASLKATMPLEYTMVSIQSALIKGSKGGVYRLHACLHACFPAHYTKHTLNSWGKRGVTDRKWDRKWGTGVLPNNAWHWPEHGPFRNLSPLNMHQFSVLMKNRLGLWEKESGL